MSNKAMERRLATLEQQRGPRVVAVQDMDEHERGMDANTVQLCVPGGGGERMTLDEWRRRYPHGTLIRFVYGDEDITEPFDHIDR